MELAVVSISRGADRIADQVLPRLADRLKHRAWAGVHVSPELLPAGERLATLVGSKALAVQSIDIDDLITQFAGSRVVLACEPVITRGIAATVMGVAEPSLAMPRDFSLTVIWGSRRGDKTLHCLNDTLHLAGARPAIDPTSKGDQRYTSKVEGVPLL